VQLHAQAQALRQQGRLQEAVNAFQQAIQAFPGNSAPYQGLLELLIGLNESASAARVFAAIPPALYQQSGPLRLLHGTFLLGQRDFDRARQIFAALEQAPGADRASLAYYLASCYGGLGQYEPALEHFRRAQAAGFESPQLYAMLGLLYKRLRRREDAEANYREGVRRFPEVGDLQYELAMFLLRTGQFEEGFRRYHHRWQAKINATPRLPLKAPEWNGKAKVDSLLVVGDQGLGDQLVFSSLLPALRGRVGRLTATFDARLHPLLQRGWPDIELIAFDAASLPETSRRFEAYVYAGDIGAVTLDGLGWSFGRLQPDTARAATLRAKYAALFPGKKLIGLSWRSPKARTDASKSLALADWQPILATPGCQFINLQYGDMTAELEALRARTGIDIYTDPEIDSFNDIDGLAAQIAALDLVVTTSNTTAHIAAAQGQATWTLLPCDAGLFWYWGWDGDHTPCYPAMRLFRAQQEGRWDDAIAAVAQALQGSV
jgi:tetratricopeptide (TPR) repeat protein